MYKRYYKWLLNKINDNDVFDVKSYSKLLKKLHETPFKWSVANDDNRAMDGMVLRDKFAFENQIEEYSEIGGPCTMLEMLVALSERCEDDIMGGDSEKNRTPLWFFEMIKNSGLDIQDDNHFDLDVVNEEIERILDRTYGSDGSNGGLFPVKKIEEDLRDVELWYQLSYWLREKYYSEDEFL